MSTQSTETTTENASSAVERAVEEELEYRVEDFKRQCHQFPRLQFDRVVDAAREAGRATERAASALREKQLTDAPQSVMDIVNELIDLNLSPPPSYQGRNVAEAFNSGVLNRTYNLARRFREALASSVALEETSSILTMAKCQKIADEIQECLRLYEGIRTARIYEIVHYVLVDEEATASPLPAAPTPNTETTEETQT